MKRKFQRIRPLLWAVVGVLVGVTVARADLGKILKGGAIALLVAQFADELNDGLNTVLVQKGAEWKESTKVVPILSVGRGSYVGAAQVAGPEEKVDEVKAVAQVELRLLGRKARAKALIPVQSETIGDKISRVEGVGVSAVIDLKL